MTEPLPITALPVATSVTADDYVPIVDAPSSAPATQRARIQQILDLVDLSGVAAATRLPVVTHTGAAYTLAATDENKLNQLNHSAAATLTVPSDAVNIPVGAEFPLRQIGAGKWTVIGAGGVTIHARAGATLTGQWSEALLTKGGANSWVLSGDIGDGATAGPMTGLEVQPDGETYRTFVVQGTLAAAPWDGAVVVRDPAGIGGIHKIWVAYDPYDQPVAWLLNEGGWVVTDVITFLRGNDFEPMVRLGWLDASANTGPAIIFDNVGTGGGTVVADGESVTLDAGKDAFLRLTDDAALNWSKVFRTGWGTGGITNTGEVGPAGQPGFAATNYLGTGVAVLYRSGADEWTTPDSFLVTHTPNSHTHVARMLETAPVPSQMPAGNPAANLTQTMDVMVGSNGYVDKDDWATPAGAKLQMRGCLIVTGQTTSDVLGVEVFDAQTNAVVIAEGTTTATNGNAQIVRTAWADAPATAWQCTLYARNQTAARGVARQGWYEFKFVAA